MPSNKVAPNVTRIKTVTKNAAAGKYTEVFIWKGRRHFYNKLTGKVQTAGGKTKQQNRTYNKYKKELALYPYEPIYTKEVTGFKKVVETVNGATTTVEKPIYSGRRLPFLVTGGDLGSIRDKMTTKTGEKGEDLAALARRVKYWNAWAKKKGMGPDKREGSYRQAIYRSKGGALPATAKEFYNNAIAYGEQTFGRNVIQPDGAPPIKLSYGKSNLARQVHLRFTKEGGGAEYRAFTLASFKKFKRELDIFTKDSGVNALISSLGPDYDTPYGSDVMDSGYEWDKSWFELRTRPLVRNIQGNAGKELRQHKYKYRDVARGKDCCALRCVREAMRDTSRMATLLKAIPTFNTTGMSPQSLTCLEKHYGCEIEVIAFESEEGLVLKATQNTEGVKQVRLLLTTNKQCGHYVLCDGVNVRKAKAKGKAKKPATNKKKKKEKGEKEPKKKETVKMSLAVDLETIFDRNSMDYLKVTSAQWYVFDPLTHKPPDAIKQDADKERKDARRQHYEETDEAKREELGARLEREGWNVDTPREKWLAEQEIETHYVDIRTSNNPVGDLIDWIKHNSSFTIVDPSTGEEEKREIRYNIVGFNSAKFDHFFLCQEAANRGDLSDVMYVNNSILSFSLYGHKPLDICKYLVCPLAAACAKFKTVPEKLAGFSHELPQKAFDAGGLEGLKKWFADNDRLQVRYSKYDVLSLADLTTKFSQGISKITAGASIFNYMTIGQMAYKLWQKTQTGSNDEKHHLYKLYQEAKEKNEKFEPNPSPLTHSDDKSIRNAMAAGRTQVYTDGAAKIEMPLRMVDVVSLYPYVMTTRQFPVGQYKYTSTYVPGKLGIYWCQIVHQKTKWQNPEALKAAYEKLPQSVKDKYNGKYAPSVFPKRSKKAGAALDWTHRGRQQCFLSSVDIECLREFAGEDSVHIIPGGWSRDGDAECAGIYWEESSDKVFTEYLDGFAKEKNRQDELAKADSPLYNEAMREGCKLFSNSLSGKVAQRNFTDFHKQLKTEEDLVAFHAGTQEDTQKFQQFGKLTFGSGKLIDENIYDTDRAKPSYHAIFIYGHAREYMYRTFLSRYIVFYEDTDSACLPLHEYNRLSEEQGHLMPAVTGKDKIYGDIEEEAGNATLAILISPKCYCVCNKEEVETGKPAEDWEGERTKCKDPRGKSLGGKVWSAARKFKFKGVRGGNTWEKLTDYPLLHAAVKEERARGKAKARGEKLEKGREFSPKELKEYRAELGSIEGKLKTMPGTLSLDMFNTLLEAGGEPSIVVYSSLLQKTVKMTAAVELDNAYEGTENEVYDSMNKKDSEFSIRQIWMAKLL